jgi:hypothetical protein
MDIADQASEGLDTVLFDSGLAGGQGRRKFTDRELFGVPLGAHRR